MKQIRKFWFPAAALALFLALTLCADTVADAARSGLALSLKTAVPALFPFFVAGALLTKSGFAETLGKLLERPVWALYGLGGNCAAALVLGLSGGYPVGAQAACTLYREGLISKREAEALLGFCNNSGPAFILGVAGLAVCGSARTGAALFLIHALAALICGLALTPAPRKGTRPPRTAATHAPRPDASTAFVSAVREGFMTCLSVTAFITFFSILLALLQETKLLHFAATALNPLFSLAGLPEGTAYAALSGTFELTNGLVSLPALALPPRLLLPLLSFLLGFGGLSVHCQALSIMQDCGLSARRHTIGKLLHGVIASALAMIWCSAAPQSVPVFSEGASMADFPGLIAGLCLLAFAVAILLIKNTGKVRHNQL